MSTTRATVSKVLNFSCVDGPGNRLVVFLQGCNFNCAACHNPHTIGVCDDCGECIPACHAGSLSLVDGRISFDPSDCDQCDACIDACPISANPMARSLSVEDILAQVRKHKPLLSGVTVSGGEPTLHLGFVIELFQAIKADPELVDLTCFVDSNGHLGEAGWARLLPVTDGVMLDIKAFSNERHMALIGKGNERSLNSVRLVHAAGKLHEIRFLLIPGETDSDDELHSLADFVASLGDDVRVRLNAFQHHGVRGDALQWEKMPEAGVGLAAQRLRMAGIDNVVTPAVYV
jgi:pyruvate formate lyase activating enzyme